MEGSVIWNERERGAIPDEIAGQSVIHTPDDIVPRGPVNSMLQLQINGISSFVELERDISINPIVVELKLQIRLR